MAITGQLDPLESPLAARWDPPAKAAPDLDLGWIGQDRDGVWLAQHPETLLLEHPDVADVYERMRLAPEVGAAEIETMSAWEHRLATEFVSSYHRRQIAEAKAGN